MTRAYPEDAVQAAAIGFVNRLVPGSLILHIPNGMHSNPVHVARMRRLGLMNGAADLLLVVDGKAHFIECKSARGRLSPEQQVFAELALRSGAKWATIRNLDDLRDALETWGIATREARHDRAS